MASAVLVLQFVGPDFVAEADTSALLHQINHGTLTLLFYHTDRLFELCTAVAPDGPENIARCTRRVNADEDRFARLPCSFDKSHVLQAVAFLFEGNETELAPLGRHGHLFALLDDALCPQTVSDNIGDGDDFQSEPVRNLQQLGQTGHGTVLVHYLDKRTAGPHAGHAGKVDGRFGMARTPQYSLVACTQRIDVSRSAEILRLGVRVHQSANGSSPVVYRHTRSTSVMQVVHRHRERRAQQGGIIADHHVEVELPAPVFGQRGTEYAAAVMQHEIDYFRSYLLGCHDEVAFVFPVFVVHHDDDLTLAEILEDLLYGIKLPLFHAFCSLFCVVFFCRPTL